MTDPDVASGRVDAADDGMRLDRVVAALLDTTRSQAAAAVTSGRVTVGGTPTTTKSHRVVAGDVVAVGPAPPRTPTPPPGLPPVRHVDEHVMVVDKPAGLVVHPGHGHPDGTLADALRAEGITTGPEPQRPGIVHRLDKDTSGVMVVARTEQAHRALVAALADRRVTRLYLATVEGTPPGSHGVIDVPLGRDEHDRTRFAARADGRHAVTHFRVLADGGVADGQGGTRSLHLVACRLETGRTHQIRVHMAHVHCPVVGDRDYGASADVAQRLGVTRTWLHASRLRFAHPVTGDDVDVTAPLPEELSRALDLAGTPMPTRVDWP